jgi:hypothetical protein
MIFTLSFPVFTLMPVAPWFNDYGPTDLQFANANIKKLACKV